jgi:hypothetical protein
MNSFDVQISITSFFLKNVNFLLRNRGIIVGSADCGLDNPTPAMLAILKRRQEVSALRSFYFIRILFTNGYRFITVSILSDKQADYNDYNLNHFSQLFCSSSLL